MEWMLNPVRAATGPFRARSTISREVETMIKFVSVTGSCAIVSDSSCVDLEEPHAGLSLPFDIERYILTTGDGAYVQMVVNQEQVELGANSVMHLRAGSPPSEMTLSGVSSTLKLWVGQAWAYMDGGGTFEEAVDNATMGVRG